MKKKMYIRTFSFIVRIKQPTVSLLFKLGQPVIGLGRLIIRLGQPVIGLGQPVIGLGQLIIRLGQPVRVRTAHH